MKSTFGRRKWLRRFTELKRPPRSRSLLAIALTLAIGSAAHVVAARLNVDPSPSTIMMHAAAVTVVSDVTVPRTHIKHFGRVNPTYFRGAAPTPSGLQELAMLGVHTVIDLKHDDIDREAALVQQLGMKFYSIPLSTSTAPSDEAVEHFLKLVNDPANQPVFVHCEGGHDRTGLMTGIYRLTHDHWSTQLAYAEMKQYGYDTAMAGPALKDFLFDFGHRLGPASKSR
jgi:protein tyrosine phosphatase (PTP) superfamily phosphohydrolase (DUF442 family)